MSYNDPFDSSSAANYSDYLNGGEFDFDGFRLDSNVNPSGYDAQRGFDSDDSHFNSGSEQFIYDPSYEPDFSAFDTLYPGYPSFGTL